MRNPRTRGLSGFLALASFLLLCSGVVWAGFYSVPAGKPGRRTELVSPRSTAAESGTALLSALDRITDASATKPYLVYIEPGVYDIGGESLQMKSYVDIQGSGEIVTEITGNRDSSSSGVVVGADNADLDYLTIENTGGGVHAVALYNNGPSPALRNVTLAAKDASYCYAAYNHGASPSMLHVTATASGGTTRNYGVYNVSGSFPIMTSVTAEATGGATWNSGVHNENSSPEMTSVTAMASGAAESNLGVFNHTASPNMFKCEATASGGTNSVAVYGASSSTLTLTRVTATASGATTGFGVNGFSGSSLVLTDVTVSVSGATNSYGVYNNTSGSAVMTNVTVSATGSSNGYGLFNTASSAGSIGHSVVSGSTNAIYNPSGSTVNVANTRLDGSVTGTGTATCAGVYDDAYTFYASTCP